MKDIENFTAFCETVSSLNIDKISEIKDYVGFVGLLEDCDKILDKIYQQKGVFTVLVTLLFYKKINPQQDIRLHQSTLTDGDKTGFSGRSFDTKYITPVLKSQNLPSMAESGWLTRSLEQNRPYNLSYPGKISGGLKDHFLQIIDRVENGGVNPSTILSYLIYQAYILSKKNIVEISKITISETIEIKELVEILTKQFNYNYGKTGTPKLPMIAFHAIYQIMLKEIGKFQNCYLADLGSITASDRTSKTAGDLEVFYKNDKSLKEAIEIKLGILIDTHMIRRAKEKIITFNPERYYILSTVGIKSDEQLLINQEIDKVRNEHGCQIIINGVLDTLKYYFRLIDNVNDFIKIYSELIEVDTEISLEHKQYWNNVIEQINTKHI